MRLRSTLSLALPFGELRFAQSFRSKSFLHQPAQVRLDEAFSFSRALISNRTFGRRCSRKDGGGDFPKLWRKFKRNFVKTSVSVQG